MCLWSGARLEVVATIVDDVSGPGWTFIKNLCGQELDCVCSWYAGATSSPGGGFYKCYVLIAEVTAFKLAWRANLCDISHDSEEQTLWIDW